MSINKLLKTLDRPIPKPETSIENSSFNPVFISDSKGLCLQKVHDNSSLVSSVQVSILFLNQSGVTVEDRFSFLKDYFATHKNLT